MIAQNLTGTDKGENREDELVVAQAMARRAFVTMISANGIGSF
jgi:hypothetical protein